jgi:hypothetical protein
MIEALPYVVEIGLLVYCLIDAIQADESQVRNLPRTGWILLIILVPLVGGIAWLAVGRPLGTGRRQVPWPSTTTAGFPEYERPRHSPDEDEFAAGVARSEAIDAQMMRDWEAQLREREQRLSSAEGAEQPAEGTEEGRREG